MLHDALGFGACHLGLGVPMTGPLAGVQTLDDLRAAGWSEQSPLRWGAALCFAPFARFARFASVFSVCVFRLCLVLGAPELSGLGGALGRRSRATGRRAPQRAAAVSVAAGSRGCFLRMVTKCDYGYQMVSQYQLVNCHP